MIESAQTIVKNASTAQRRASNPQISAFVSANAGSGKTRVLVARIIRLMLSGTAPAKILCLTFTRAAAAEMSTRLYAILSQWIALSDAELSHQLDQMSGPNDSHDLDLARQLFARALETPGGLKIQTIHAFCERLLHRFPVEAGIIPGFAVLDDRAANEMRIAARNTVLAAGLAEQSGQSNRDIATIVAYAGVEQFDKLLGNVLDAAKHLRSLWQHPDYDAEIRARLNSRFGLTDDLDEQTLNAEYHAQCDREKFKPIIAEMAAHETKTNKDQARRYNALITAGANADLPGLIRDAFFTTNGNLYKANSLITKNLRAIHPEFGAFLDGEQSRAASWLEKYNNLLIRNATLALLRLSQAIITRFEVEKRRSGRFDYDDLISRTLELVEQTDSAEWVLYKLDGGLDHILIDEAQDTSAEQWRIIARLSAEFYAGAGARTDTSRTIFAVGDPKQSIYSFQGADPQEFENMLNYFSSRITQAGQKFDNVPLRASFRSVQKIMMAVDEVFNASKESKRGIFGDIIHEATRRNDPGLVEIWPLMKPGDKVHFDPWQGMEQDPEKDHPEVKLARRIAHEIKGWIDNREILESLNRPIEPGDILILLRRRSTLMNVLVSSLKQLGIPVAGADRLKLNRAIAVQDLKALARFVLLPEDDLNCASLLKSSLLARDDGLPIDDDDLFDLAYQRGQRSLWHRLQDAAESGKPYQQAVTRLSRWWRISGQIPPYEFYNQVLISDEARRTMLSRLGTEAGEPIDAFLTLCLDFENDNAPSLISFLDWLDIDDSDIKRDMEQSGNEVRIMTVHGAKGLEANIVFLPDTTSLPSSQTEPGFIVDLADDADSLPVWKLKSAYKTDVIDSIWQKYRDAALDEYNRLLYVAMTRARDRLYIAGYSNKDKQKPECWYELVQSGLKELLEEVTDSATGEVLCLRIKGETTTPPTPATTEIAPTTPATPSSVPDWINQNAPPHDTGTPWLRPSQLMAVEDDITAPAAEQFLSPLNTIPQHRFRRGNLIHNLLQYLPTMARDKQALAARSYLEHQASDLSDDIRRDIADEVLRLLHDARFAAVFTPGSQAEVAIAASLDITDAPASLIHGRIDRLVVRDEEILIVDYKTNRPPPLNVEQVDPVYIKQMAAYATTLRKLYPDRSVRAALLWTDGPHLMELPAQYLTL